MREITPRPETWILWLLFATAFWCASGFAQAAQGQYCVDQFGNRVPCQQPSYQQWPQYSQPQENIVQMSGWTDPRIVLLDGGGTASFCTANGRVFLLSCAHESARSNIRVGQQIPFRNNLGNQFVATVVSVDPRSDCSVMTFNAQLRQTTKPFPIAENALQRGEQVYVAGFPNGRYRVRVATVQSDGDMLSLSGAATPGESGGPIINSRGEIAGVLFGDEIHDGRSIGRTLCAGRGPIRQLVNNVMDRAANIIATATGQRSSHGSPGGQYNGQLPAYYGEPPYEQPPPPYVPPVVDIDPNPPDAPEPDIDYEAWEEQQEENEKRHAQTQEQLQSLVVKVNNIDTGWVEPMIAVQDRLTEVGNSLIKLTENDNRIINIITKLESQPATGTTAPAGPQISYYDIVPRKK